MSMWLSFVRVSAPAFEKIRAKPDLLERVFFGESKEDEAAVRDELGVEQDHSAGLDYRMMDEALEHMAELDGDAADEDEEDGDAVIGDLGPDGTIEYDAGYGDAFFLAPASVQRALAQSATIQGDEEVLALFKVAAKEQQYVIGVVT